MAIQFVNNVDFNANQAQSIRIENLATDPSTELVIGRIIFNTSADTLKQYVANDGTGSPGWVEVGGGVTSVGLSMPAAFTVTNSPVTSTGTLTVTGAGSTSQYVDGTGALQTFPTLDNYQYWTLSDGTTSTNITSTGTATFQGTANEVEVGESSGTITIGLPDDVTITGELTVNGTGQSSFAGQVTIPTTPVAGTDAASKAYVDSLVAGGLTFRGTFNAATGEILSGVNSGSYIYQLTGTPPAPFDPSANRVEVKVGDYYIVATAGQFYGNGGTGGGGQQLDVGDSVIGFQAASANSSDKDDWSIVQSDEGVTDVQEATAVELLGASVTSTGAGGTGSVTVGLDIASIPQVTSTPSGAGDAYFPFYDDGSSENKSISLENLAAEIDISKGVRISLDGSLAYVTRTEAGGLTTFAVAVNNSSVVGATSALDVKAEITTAAGQTVYADVTRSGTTLSVIFTGSVANGTYSALLVDVG